VPAPAHRSASGASPAPAMAQTASVIQRAHLRSPTARKRNPIRPPRPPTSAPSRAASPTQSEA
jgi:hypothetical protein